MIGSSAARAWIARSSGAKKNRAQRWSLAATSEVGDVSKLGAVGAAHVDVEHDRLVRRQIPRHARVEHGEPSDRRREVHHGLDQRGEQRLVARRREEELEHDVPLGIEYGSTLARPPTQTTVNAEWNDCRKAALAKRAALP
jgi:hypothetical protein